MTIHYLLVVDSGEARVRGRAISIAVTMSELCSHLSVRWERAGLCISGGLLCLDGAPRSRGSAVLPLPLGPFSPPAPLLSAHSSSVPWGPRSPWLLHPSPAGSRGRRVLRGFKSSISWCC